MIGENEEINQKEIDRPCDICGKKLKWEHDGMTARRGNQYKRWFWKRYRAWCCEYYYLWSRTNLNQLKGE